MRIETPQERGQQDANSCQRTAYVYRRDDGSLYTLNFKTDGCILEVEPRYRSMEDVRKRNDTVGGTWFDPSNMRFFGSRIHESVYLADGGRLAYFVTSERDRRGAWSSAWSGRQLYSVRVAKENGDIDTVGDFGGYTTGRAAHAEARRLAGEELGAIRKGGV
jgi:hypothetical protein